MTVLDGALAIGCCFAGIAAAFWSVGIGIVFFVLALLFARSARG